MRLSGQVKAYHRSIWERLVGPAITFGAALALSNLDPLLPLASVALLVALVPFSAYVGGLASGLTASAIVVTFFAAPVWTVGTRVENEWIAEVGTIALSCIGSSILVSGVFSRRRSAVLSRPRVRLRPRLTRRIEDLVESIDAVLWEADPSPFKFTLVSRGSERLLGIPAQRWLEEGFWENLIHPDDRRAVVEARQREISAGRDHELTYRMMFDKTVIWIQDVATIVTDFRGNPIKVRGRLVNITKQKLSEQRLATVYAAGETLSHATTLEAAAPRILEVVCRSLGWQVGELWRVNHEDQVLDLVDLWYEDIRGLEPFIEATRSTRFSIGVGLPGQVWQTNAPAWIRDVSSDTNFPRAMKAETGGIHSAFGIPILSSGEMVGVMDFFSDEMLEPDSDLLSMMTSVGNQLGQRIERARAEEEVRENDARKTAILENAQDAIVTVDQKGIICEFNPAAEKLFGFTRDEIVGRRLVDTIIPESLRERHLRAFERYLTTHEPTVIGRRLEMPALRADQSEILVQLTISPVDQVEGQRLFTAFLRDITVEKKEEQVRTFLAEVSTILASSLEYEEVLRQVILRTTPFLGDYAFIDSLEADGSIRRICSALTDSQLGEHLNQFNTYLEQKEGTHPVARALETGEVQVVPFVAEDWIGEDPAGDSTRLRLVPTPIKSLMVIPLSARGKALGAMGFLSSVRTRSYGPYDVALAEEVARRVSLQLDNAMRYRERSKIARTLEASLLPRKLPEIPNVQVVARYRSGAEQIDIGGDFYDVFSYGQKRWGIVIGDVSGKGAQAAALTALLRYTIRAEALQEREPSRILGVVNEAVIEQGLEEQYCTLAYSRLDSTETGAHLTVVSGGHPLPYLISKKGNVKAIGRPGTALGLFPEVEFEEQHLDLASGDTVVFYTDGVVEARSSNDIFGEERFIQLLKKQGTMPADRLADEVVSAVMQYAEGGLRDDLAILVLRVE